MKKRNYQKPAMKTVYLRQKTSLLTGSVPSTRMDYGTAIEFEWE